MKFNELQEITMSSVTVVGSINMDLVCYTDRLPRIGETVTGTAFETSPGGKGANQACAAALLGAEVTMVGRTGDDIFGAAVTEHLRSAGADTSGIEALKDYRTGTASITVTGGDNCIILSPGANHALKPGDITKYEELLSRSDIVLIQMEIPLETVAAVIETCRRLGTPVLLDPAPAQKLDAGLLSMVTYLTPNESEAEILTGISVSSPDDVLRALKMLRGFGIDTVCIKLGEKGVICSSGDEVLYQPAYAVKAVDTTAAGDAFSAAFAVAVTSSYSTSEALDFAQRVSALSVTKAGAQPSLPSAEQVRCWNLPGRGPNFMDGEESDIRR